MKHYIVTGGAGFIGSHLTETLLAAGNNVTVVDNLSTGKFGNLPDNPHLKFIQKDIAQCQPDDFPETIDGIAHLAATPSVTESWLQPLEAHHNNLSSIINVIQLCEKLNIPRLVFASSAAVYGQQNHLPIFEDLETVPISPYGLQKLVCEKYGSLFAEKIGFSFVGLRFFNVFGPRQAPNSQYSGVISVFVNAMQENLPITIYGDGTQTRDFIYVKDVADGLTKALTKPLEPGSSLICNLGTGKTTSLLQLVDALKGIYQDWKSEVGFAPGRLGDIPHSQADISKITSHLNFIPQCSLESSLQIYASSLG
ncbi:MAG: NAD-dependent epimerase/dehydratase family protein [Scytonematopsis contorta HA4267-MV1]|jgi:UDP-glucose 4-epimerase|nr:NAD-dependent epimerase/dehydratase family protein [Scytonematopsis contorta HA4267-MV1]